MEEEELELAVITPPMAPSATMAPPTTLASELALHDSAPILDQDRQFQEGAPQPLERAAEPRTLPPKSQVSQKRRVAGTSLLSQQRSMPRILGEWLHTKQRLRILIGFLLALGLGAIGPTCYSSSVITKRITPQLEDLSTVKAHGHILAHMPNYRSAEEIESTISSIKIRYGIFTILMWICISGIVGLLWFRLT